MTCIDFPEDLSLEQLKSKHSKSILSPYNMEVLGNTSLPEIEATEFEETDLTDDEPFVPLKAVPPAPATKTSTPRASNKTISPTTSTKQRHGKDTTTKPRNSSASEEQKRKVMEAMAFLAAQGAAKSVAKGHKAAARAATRPAVAPRGGMTVRQFTLVTIVTFMTMAALVVSFRGLEKLPTSLSDVLVTRILGLKTLHITRGVLFYILAYALVEFGEAYMPEDFMMDGSVSKQQRGGRRRQVPSNTRKDR